MATATYNRKFKMITLSQFAK